MKPLGRVVETLFLMQQLQARSVENSLLWGQNFVSSTYCMNFSWFEFVCHEAGWDKVISIFNVESCVLLVQIVCSMT